VIFIVLVLLFFFVGDLHGFFVVSDHHHGSGLFFSIGNPQCGFYYNW
jgi:hypothetical protein